MIDISRQMNTETKIIHFSFRCSLKTYVLFCCFFFSFRWQEFTQSDNFLVSPIFFKLLRQKYSWIEFHYSPINLNFQKIPYSPVLHQSMAEKRLSTLQIKYNDKTHWLAQRKYQSFNILSPMLLKKKKTTK